MDISINPLQHDTLSEQVYNRLLDALLQQVIKPGDRLKLEEMAAQLGVSPTPLRQALSRLHAEGIVHSQPRRGMYVARLSQRSMAELFEARLMCEVYAAEQAAPHITAEQLSRIERFVDEYARTAVEVGAGKRKAWAKQEIEFHQYIVDLAGNGRISAWFRTLGVHLHSLILIPVGGDRDQASVGEHWEIYHAFATHDAGRARASVSAHILASKRYVLEMMAGEADQPGAERANNSREPT